MNTENNAEEFTAYSTVAKYFSEGIKESQKFQLK
jgi:hypothetical protein